MIDPHQHPSLGCAYAWRLSVITEKLEMKQVLFTLLLAATLQGCANFAKNMDDFTRGYNQTSASMPQSQSQSSQGHVALLHSQQVTGSTKQCYYDYFGSIHTRTIEYYELCPLEIKP